MRYRILVFISLFIPLSLYAQTENTLRLEDIYKQMIAYHPMVKNSDILLEIAKRELLISRSNFDPKIKGSYLTKELKDKFYYSYWNSALKIPLWVGEVKVGYELNEGDLISKEYKSPEKGLLYAGISVPLGKNLLIDARRKTLLKAKYLQSIAKAERRKEINKLFLKANKAYWDWFTYYNDFKYLKDSYNLSSKRLEFVKQNIIGGDLAPIDSVEAKINMQDRLVKMRKAEVDLKNAKLYLSNFLWGENDTPRLIPDNAIPQKFDYKNDFLSESALKKLLEDAKKNHPEILKLDFKIKQLSVDKKYYKNNFLPSINLHYNFLNLYNSPLSKIEGSSFTKNYKFGLDFSIPILFRKERGKYQKTILKINQTNHSRNQKIREITNHITTVYNDMLVLEKNVRTQELLVQNYKVLLDGENIKFRNGESAIFYVNVRETKLILAQIKLATTKAKYEKEKAMLQWAAGLMLWKQ